MRRSVPMEKNLYLMLVLVPALLYAGIVAYEERNAVYHYDVRKDYVYDFTSAHPVLSRHRMRNGKFVIGDPIPAGDTVFLKIRLRTTPVGRFFDPKVFVYSGGRMLVQTIERGGAGTRYLNLSGLPLDAGTTLSLTGRHVRIDDQTVNLIRLKNAIDLKHARILVLAPHPDDAEIAACGLYSGHDAYIVTVTAGDGGDIKYGRIYADNREQFIAKARMRVWNSLTVPLLGGLTPERCLNLGYFDGTLMKMHEDRKAPVRSMTTGVASINVFRGPKDSRLQLPHPDGRATWDGLVRDLRHVIAAVHPDLFLAPHPVLDRHPDHKMATLALIEAIKSLHLQSGRLLLYTNHDPLSEYYPFGDAGEIVSLPPQFGRIDFDGVYSYKLKPSMQRMKLLALDAMNDLRPNTGWRSIKGAAKLLLRALRRTLEGNDYSYFRRAVRANELFFVVNVRSLYKKGIPTKGPALTRRVPVPG